MSGNLFEKIFENNNPRGRPSKHSRREIVNAALYVLRTGIQWRLLPKDFPPWQTVYSHLRIWRENNTLEKVFKKLREAYRLLSGRNRQPTAAIVDSQSVKTTERGIKGFDPAKKIKGRKRHILGDTQGLLLSMIVTGANIQDRDGLSLLLSSFRKRYPKVTKIWADMGYRSKSLQQEAMKNGFEIDIVKPHPKWVSNPKQSKDARAELVIALGFHEEKKRGFNVLPRRWVVKRTFAWINKYRRLSKVYEQKTATTNLYIYLAMTNLLLKRLSGAVL